MKLIKNVVNRVKKSVVKQYNFQVKFPFILSVYYLNEEFRQTVGQLFELYVDDIVKHYRNMGGNRFAIKAQLLSDIYEAFDKPLLDLVDDQINTPLESLIYDIFVYHVFGDSGVIYDENKDTLADLIERLVNKPVTTGKYAKAMELYPAVIKDAVQPIFSEVERLINLIADAVKNDKQDQILRDIAKDFDGIAGIKVVQSKNL